GMDPYLEEADLWLSVHIHVLTEICRSLQPQLNPRYYARAEQRVLLEPLPAGWWPDLTIWKHGGETGGAVAVLNPPVTSKIAVGDIVEDPDWLPPHRFVVIRDARNRAVITVIELLSPWNKTGRGRTDYGRKQRAFLE